MRTRRYTFAGTAAMLLLLTVLLAACGSVDFSGDESGGDEGASGGGSRDMAMTEDMPKSGAAGVASQPESGSTSGSQTQSSTQTLPDDFDRKIVKTANLGVRSEDVRGSAAEAQQIAARHGGIVLSSQVNQADEQKEDQLYADLVLSVPSQEFESALAELRGLGKKVVQDTVAGQDVTEEFVDLEARERNLLATEKSLLDLYDRAESIEDTLTIQRELTVVRGEIELVQGRIQYLEQRTAFSQITVSIQPVAAPGAVRPGWDPGAVAAKAWAASLNVLQGAATVAISAAVFGWWLVPLIILGLMWWRRRNRETSPAGTSS